MDSRSIDVTRSADLIIRQLLAVKPDEQVAIVCDPHSEMSMVYALAGVIESVGGEYTIMMMPTTSTRTHSETNIQIAKTRTSIVRIISGVIGLSLPSYSCSLYETGR